jgi:DNA 3'-phosphatase
MRQLDIPLSIYAATQADEYRKPRTGMWKELMEDYDLDLDDRLDLKGSFFVGDAAGRPADHSCSDRYVSCFWYKKIKIKNAKPTLLIATLQRMLALISRHQRSSSLVQSLSK